MKNVATARVRIVLDIPLADTWGGECAIEQIQKQATDEVLGMLRNNRVHELVNATIVGHPEVTAILVKEDR